MSSVPLAGSPVFVDVTGHRVRAARVAVQGMTGLLLLLVAVTVVSLVGGVPLPGLLRPITTPAGQSPPPQQKPDQPNVSVAGLQRGAVAPPSQAAVAPVAGSPGAALAPVVTAAATPPAVLFQPTQVPGSDSVAVTSPVSITAATTPTSAPDTPVTRPTPPNRPIQPPGLSGSHGPDAQHGPPPGHGPPAGRGPQAKHGRSQ